MTNGKEALSILLLVVLCALPGGISPLLAIAPSGSETFLFELVPVFLFMGAVLMLIVSPLLFFFRNCRSFALRSLLGSAVLMNAVLIGDSFGTRLHREAFLKAFHGLAERSTPLVQAIKSYEVRYGSPPPDLSALVPEFLPSVPGTGMAIYPQYKYYTAEKAAEFEGNPWVLVVSTSTGVLNWDQFMYFPLQNYPDTGYGGQIERIADWAYVHE